MLDTWRRLHGHRRAVSLTTIFDEHYPTLRDTASRADERMVLDTTGRDGVVRHHAGQDQLSATGTRTHYSHSDCTHLPNAHPIIGDAYALFKIAKERMILFERIAP